MVFVATNGYCNQPKPRLARKKKKKGNIEVCRNVILLLPNVDLWILLPLDILLYEDSFMASLTIN